MVDKAVAISQDDLEKVRRLKGLYQSENPGHSFSNRDAVMNAVESELERFQE